MKRLVLTILLGAGVLTPPASAATQTVFLDAAYAHTATAGPPADTIGHVQSASGPLRDAAGHNVGRFAFSCSWVAILPGGDAREHCTGSGTTADGRLGFAGPTRGSEPTHTWRIASGSGAYRGAHGTVAATDVGDRESLITVTARAPAVLRTAVIPRPAANRAFRVHANAACERAAAQLASLPPFPFSTFDPLHPDPAQLPLVGQFFTGPGDPRPILTKLDADLRALGRPPADAHGWARVLTARSSSLAARSKQDDAALQGNVPAFVASVHDVSKTYRAVALTATLFGVERCVI
jgi:hypothetical protein